MNTINLGSGGLPSGLQGLFARHAAFQAVTSPPSSPGSASASSTQSEGVPPRSATSAATSGAAEAAASSSSSSSEAASPEPSLPEFNPFGAMFGGGLPRFVGASPGGMELPPQLFERLFAGITDSLAEQSGGSGGGGQETPLPRFVVESLLAAIRGATQVDNSTAASTLAALPVITLAGTAGNECVPADMTVKELKRRLSLLRVSFAGLIEKSEFVAALEAALEAAQRAQQQAGSAVSPSSSGTAAPPSPHGMSLAELKRHLTELGVKFHGFVEKQEFVSALEQAQEAEAAASRALTKSMSECFAAGADTTCTICMGELVPGDVVTQLPVCGHWFHHGGAAPGEGGEASGGGGCPGVLPWLRKSHTCPNCKHELPKERDAQAAAQDSAQADERGGAEAVLPVPLPPAHRRPPPSSSSYSSSSSTAAASLPFSSSRSSSSAEEEPFRRRLRPRPPAPEPPRTTKRARK